MRWLVLLWVPIDDFHDVEFEGEKAPQVERNRYDTGLSNDEKGLGEWERKIDAVVVGGCDVASPSTPRKLIARAQWHGPQASSSLSPLTRLGAVGTFHGAPTPFESPELQD